MGRIGMPEVILILAIFILFFGAKKLPEIGAAIGKAMKEFKKGMREAKEDDNQSIENKNT